MTTPHQAHAPEPEMADWHIYLDRMAKPLQEKLRIARYLPPRGAHILDVGCADGAVTRALATLFPENTFLGIDLSERFVALAQQHATDQGLLNVRFERVYLRELLARSDDPSIPSIPSIPSTPSMPAAAGTPNSPSTPGGSDNPDGPGRFDAVVFCSVLHEFYTYGEGISSVLKALADAHELLRPGGAVVIRDMVLRDYTRRATQRCVALRARMEAALPPHVVTDFTRHFGPPDTLYTINHLLLKYWYTENWARECPEFYVPVTFEQYEQVFTLLGMRLQVQEELTLPFLRDKWRADFGFAEEDLDLLRSTGILVAEKAT